MKEIKQSIYGLGKMPRTSRVMTLSAKKTMRHSSLREEQKHKVQDLKMQTPKKKTQTSRTKTQILGTKTQTTKMKPKPPRS